MSNWISHRLAAVLVYDVRGEMRGRALDFRKDIVYIGKMGSELDVRYTPLTFFFNDCVARSRIL
jgi:hypothetical protein